MQLGYFVGSFQISTVGGWRFMYGFSAPLAVLMGLGMLPLPASPRWLLLKAVQGKGSFQDLKEKAIVSLSKLRGRPPGDKESEKQIEESIVSLKSAYEDQESEANFLEVFQGPNLKAFIIGGGLVLFQQVVALQCAELFHHYHNCVCILPLFPCYIEGNMANYFCCLSDSTPYYNR
jgi:MFS family permease